VFNYGFDQDPPFAAAILRLATLRRRERKLRRLIMVWAFVSIAWVLPMGGMSAENLQPRAAFAAGCALLCVGLILVVKHRALVRVRVIERVEAPAGEVASLRRASAAAVSAAPRGVDAKTSAQSRQR
jgi:hypothetical protein